MTKSQTAQLFAGLKRSYPTTHVDPAALDEYHRHLEPYPLALCQKAADDHARTRVTFPVVADLLDRVRTLMRDQVDEHRTHQQDREPEADKATPDEYRQIRQQIATAIRSVEEGPSPDLLEAARRCHHSWREALGPEQAEQRVRRHYPDQAEAVIAEARHLLEDST